MNLSNIFFAGPANAAGTRIRRTASRRATRTVTRTVTRTATGSAARWAARLSVLCLIALAQFPSLAVASAIEQLIVTDGERVHFYDKDLKQVTVRKVTDAVGATPAAILFGSNDLEANFTIKDLGTSEGVDWLEALPRSKESGFDRIRIGFRTGLPVAMEVLDSFGQTTRFVFRAIDRNPKLDAGLFRFTAPAGVDVVQ